MKHRHVLEFCQLIAFIIRWRLKICTTKVYLLTVAYLSWINVFHILQFLVHPALRSMERQYGRAVVRGSIARPICLVQLLEDGQVGREAELWHLPFSLLLYSLYRTDVKTLFTRRYKCRNKLLVIAILSFESVDNQNIIGFIKDAHFYSAPQCSHSKRCTSYGNSVHLSVRPFVTQRYCVKTTARSTVQFALSDSKMCLVL